MSNSFVISSSSDRISDIDDHTLRHILQDILRVLARHEKRNLEEDRHAAQVTLAKQQADAANILNKIDKELKILTEE